MVPWWPVSGLRQATGAPGSPNWSARRWAAPAAGRSRGSSAAATGMDVGLALGAGTEPVNALGPPDGPENPASPAQAASTTQASAAATMRNPAMSPAAMRNPGPEISRNNRAKLRPYQTTDDGRQRTDSRRRCLRNSVLCRPSSVLRLSRGQHECRAQAADRCGAERQFAAVEIGEFDDDREAEPRARLRFIKAAPALGFLYLPALPRRKAGAVVVDHQAHDGRMVRRLRPFRHDFEGDARARPFARIVDEVADTLLEVLALAEEARIGRRLDVDRDAAVVMNFLHGARERGHHRPNLGDGADPGGAGGKPCALEVARDLIAHDADLLAHFGGERILAARCGLVHHHRERRLERMREVADVGARALDDIAVGVDECVGLTRQRRDLLGKAALQPLRRARSEEHR